VGAIVGVSRLGKVSGAHINPAVTIAFLAEGKLAARDALGYVVAQFAGALLAIPILAAWGAIGASVQFGATVPEPSRTAAWAVLGEAGVTFVMVTVIFLLAAHRRTQPLTPWSMPFLFAVMVWLEAPLSGTSANPARTLAPNILAGDARFLWIYLFGPITGALAAVGLFRLEAMHQHHPPAARVAHFHLERENE
jgi:aquaporin Z